MEFLSPRRLLASIVILVFAWTIANVLFPLDDELASAPPQLPAALSTDR